MMINDSQCLKILSSCSRIHTHGYLLVTDIRQYLSRCCSTDPSINLNFSIFLYNSGERKEAAKQFNIYERKMEAYRSEKGNEIDQEVCKALFSVLL